jgi:tetratricopeptide (TPR) repeat protein
MATANREKRSRLIQMAEGYLDLTMVFEDRWPLAPQHCIKMADRAIDCLNGIVRPLGHKPKILFLKGQAHRAAGRYQRAIHFLEQSIKIDMENVHTSLALAWCQKRVGKLADAIDTLNNALEFDPDHAITHYNLACYWALEENIPSAVEHLSVALDLNHDFRKYIEDETDFDLIRDAQPFQAAVAVNA